MRALEKWLQRAGAKRIRPSGEGHVVATCPFHDDTVDSATGRQFSVARPTFSMNMRTGAWLCYAATCGAAGNLISLLMDGCGLSFKKAVEEANLALDGDGREEADDATEYMPDYDKRRSKAVRDDQNTHERDLVLFHRCPKYLRERGFDKSVLANWEVGFDPTKRRVTIPVRDAEGHLVGFSRRATVDGDNPKYLHLGFSKGSLLYGLHKVRRRRVAVPMEGQLDVIAFDQLAPDGDWSPVSTMGALVSDRQVRLLSTFDKVVMAFDNDEGGWKATYRVGDELLETMPPNSVFVADEFPRGCKDVGEILEKGKDISRLLTKYKPYDDYRLETLDRWSRLRYNLDRRREASTMRRR